MKALRTGIVGVGNMGFAHALCIYEGRVDGMCLSALCDINEAKLSTASEKFKVPVFKNFEDMFSSGLLDAVIIAVPHPLHAVIAESAFRHGLHVMLEKPEDVTVTAARRLNETAKKSGKVFGIMFNQRTNELFARARDIVRGGELGELKRTVWIVTNWYRTQSYYDSGDWRATWSGEGGGVLLNQAPHNLDLWQWICGMPKSVTAFCDVAKYHNIEVEDDAAIFTRYENGAVGTFITTTGEFPGTNRLEISGSLGKIVLEDGKLKWWRLKTDEREFRFSYGGGTGDIPLEYEEFTQSAPESGHRGILQNFTNAVLKGDSLIAEGYEGINELSISNAAYLSSWNGNREIQLPFDEAEFDSKLRLLADKDSLKGNNKSVQSAGGYKKRWQVRW